MATRVQRIIEEMQAARLRSIRQSGVIATCVEGLIWITRDNDPNDRILQAGESFTTTSRHRVIFQALVRSRVLLDCPVRRELSIRPACVALLNSIRAATLEVASRYGLRLRNQERSDRHSATA
jgi:hypothetical protein